jgi:FdhD protein
VATIGWGIKRYHRCGEAEELEDRVAVELPLEIIVNGMPLVALMRLPGMDKELAVGFCLTEKVIQSFSQVNLLKHCGQLEREIGAGGQDKGGELDQGNVVELEVSGTGQWERFSATYVVRTGCGGADLSAVANYEEGMVSSQLKVEADVIYGIGEELTRRQEIFLGTGGTHGAGVFDAQGKSLVVAEDVGRHNALDKAVGWCAMRDVSLEDKILALSGRMSYEMALKAARVGIPIMVSMAAPTSLGLHVADKVGLTTIGFSDGRRFNLYTHPWRIVS